MKLSAKILMLMAVFLYTSIEISYAMPHKTKHREKKAPPQEVVPFFYTLNEKALDNEYTLLKLKVIPGAERHRQNPISDIRIYLAPDPTDSYMEVDSPNDGRLNVGFRCESHSGHQGDYLYGESFEGVFCKKDRNHKFDYVKYDSEALKTFARNLWNYRIMRRRSDNNFVISFHGKHLIGRRSFEGIVVWFNQEINDGDKFIDLLDKKLNP